MTTVRLQQCCRGLTTQVNFCRSNALYPVIRGNYTGTFHTYCTRIFVLGSLVVVYDNWRSLTLGPL